MITLATLANVLYLQSKESYVSFALPNFTQWLLLMKEYFVEIDTPPFAWRNDVEHTEEK